MMNRYTYATAKSLERANLMLENMFAEGEVSEGERPMIERRKDHKGKTTHYEITLADR